MKLLLFFIVGLSPAFSNSKSLSEQELLSYIETSPQMLQVRAQLAQINASLEQTKSVFAPRIESSVYYNKTKEPSLVVFSPPNQPFYNGEVLLKQQTKHGLRYSIGFKGESLTSDAANINSARFSPSLSVSLPLLRDSFGSQSRNNFKALDLQSSALKLEERISKEALSAEVRKLFWNFSILNEKQVINQELLGLTKKLLKDVRKKKRQGFVESGELLAVESQNSGQNANLLMVKYQVENIKKALKVLLPDLPNDFDLEIYNLTGKADLLKICLQKIQSYKKTPMKWALASEKVKNLEKALAHSKTALKTFNLPELELFGTYSGAHVDQRLQKAFDDFSSQGRYGFSVGLRFSASLSAFVGKEKEKRLASETYKSKSQVYSIKSDLDSTHMEARKSVAILDQALKEQKKSSQSLRRSYLFKKKQYAQARADLSDVLLEQNNYLKSRLAQLDISKLVVDTLLNYKSKFQSFTCNEVGL